MTAYEIKRMWALVSDGVEGLNRVCLRYNFNQAIRPYGFRVGFDDEVDRKVDGLITSYEGRVVDMHRGCVYHMTDENTLKRVETLDRMFVYDEEV